MFTASLGIAWLMVKAMGVTWDNALLMQILWMATLIHWHQPDNGVAK